MHFCYKKKFCRQWCPRQICLDMHGPTMELLMLIVVYSYHTFHFKTTWNNYISKIKLFIKQLNMADLPNQVFRSINKKFVYFSKAQNKT